MIARLLTTLLGVVFVVYGAIAALSPLPLGVPLMVVGLLMIAGANPAARPLIRRMRAKWGWFDRLVEMAAKRSPGNFSDVAMETAPEDNKDGAQDADKTEPA